MLRSRRGRPPATEAIGPAGPTLALAGAGAMGTLHALAATAAGLPVTAVASRTRARAEERAAQLGARPCTYDELPAGADAVVVATPPAVHAEQVRHALAAGAAVLVEKPLTTTLADADAVVEAAATGTVVYAENLAFAPVVVEARRRAATLGPLRFVEARTLSPRPGWGDFLERSWGGGALFDLGAHPIALVLLLAGDDEPVAVSATLSAGDGLAVDDHGIARLRFASGLEARVEASWRHPDVVWDVQASSDTGVVRADLFPQVALEHDGEPAPLPAPPSGADPMLVELGYLDQVEALRRAVAGDGSAVDAALGRRVLDVLCGAYASARSGAPEPLPFTGPRHLTPVELWRP